MLGRWGWVTISIEPGQEEEEERLARIDESYRAVAPKKLSSFRTVDAPERSP